MADTYAATYLFSHTCDSSSIMFRLSALSVFWEEEVTWRSSGMYAVGGDNPAVSLCRACEYTCRVDSIPPPRVSALPSRVTYPILFLS